MSATLLAQPEQERGRKRPRFSRERQIFPLFSQGLSRQQVASKLGLHYECVRHYHLKYCKVYGAKRTTLKVRVGACIENGMLSAKEIAIALDASLHTVQRYCSLYKLAEHKRKPNWRRALLREAKSRGMTGTELRHALLASIVERGMIQELLEPKKCLSSQSSSSSSGSSARSTP